MQKYIHWGYFMCIKSRENPFLKCLNFKNYSPLVIGGLNRKWTWKGKWYDPNLLVLEWLMIN